MTNEQRWDQIFEAFTDPVWMKIAAVAEAEAWKAHVLRYRCGECDEIGGHRRDCSKWK